MLTINLKPIFAARAIEKPYVFLTKNGFTHSTAKDLLNGRVKAINLAYIERLCTLLWCEPNELLLWEPADKAQVPANHPLLPLTRQVDAGVNFKNALLKVPLKKMEELSALLYKEIEDSKGV
jgi:DNA-binding Xre family transcriptional regulator